LVVSYRYNHSTTTASHLEEENRKVDALMSADLSTGNQPAAGPSESIPDTIEIPSYGKSPFSSSFYQLLVRAES
jgi:hypothetical protein